MYAFDFYLSPPPPSPFLSFSIRFPSIVHTYTCMCVHCMYQCINSPIGFLFIYPQEAEKAKAALDKKKVLGKRIVVDWAKTDLGAVKKNVSSVLSVEVVIVQL